MHESKHCCEEYGVDVTTIEDESSGHKVRLCPKCGTKTKQPFRYTDYRKELFTIFTRGHRQ